MSVYIPGMEMPKNCIECEWCVHTIPADNFICLRRNRAVIGVTEEDVNKTVNACCPLVPVPPHGRLIDADVLLAEYDKIHVGKPGGARLLMANAPTIIPAEEGE